jgi:hypothetical protein
MNKKEQQRLARAAEKASMIQKRADEWQSFVTPYFGYLETDYGFRVTQVDASSPWRIRMIYQTATTAIYVDCNFEFLRVEVSLVRLLDGELPPYPVFIRRNTTMHEFMLDSLLHIRAQHLLPEIWDLQGLGEEKIKQSLKLFGQALNDYAADILRGDFSIFATLEDATKKRVQKMQQRRQVEEQLPRHVQVAFEFITYSTDAFCHRYLNEDYTDLCVRFTKALCLKEPSPLQQGKYKTWACAIIHAMSVVNVLLDAPQPPSLSEEQISNHFKLSIKTMRTKSRQISKLLDLHIGTNLTEYVIFSSSSQSVR